MIVYKIGGSSLDSKYKLNSILKILNKNNEKKIIVVSAIGRYPDSYSTDTLISNTKYVSKEESDLLISTGEIISSVFFSNFLNENKIKALTLSPYIFNVNNIDKQFINNTFKFYDCIIIPGFIYTENNIIKTMPRGGSTITASLLAKEFSKKLIIITNICGIYDKDPKYKDAKYYKKLTYDEFINLNKTEVFFPKVAINILKENNIETSFIKYDDCSKKTKVI